MQHPGKQQAVRPGGRGGDRGCGARESTLHDGCARLQDSAHPEKEDWSLGLDGMHQSETAQLLAQRSMFPADTNEAPVRGMNEPINNKVFTAQEKRCRKDSAGVARIFGLSLKSLNMVHGVKDVGLTPMCPGQQDSMERATAMMKNTSSAPGSGTGSSSSGNRFYKPGATADSVQCKGVRRPGSSHSVLVRRASVGAIPTGLKLTAVETAEKLSPAGLPNMSPLPQAQTTDGNRRANLPLNSTYSTSSSHVSSRQLSDSRSCRTLPSGCRWVGNNPVPNEKPKSRQHKKGGKAEEAAVGRSHSKSSGAVQSVSASSGLSVTARRHGRSPGQMKSKSDSAAVEAEFWDDELTDVFCSEVKAKATQAASAPRSEPPVLPSNEEISQRVAKKFDTRRNVDLAQTPKRLLLTSNPYVDVGDEQITFPVQLTSVKQHLPKCKPKPEVESEPEPECKFEPKPEAKSESEPEPKCEPKPEVESEPEPECKFESKPEVESEPEPEPKYELDPKPEPKSEPESEPSPKPTSELEPESESEAGPEPGCKSDPEPEPETKSMSEPEAEPKFENKSGPKSEPGGFDPKSYIPLPPPAEDILQQPLLPEPSLQAPGFESMTCRTLQTERQQFPAGLVEARVTSGSAWEILDTVHSNANFPISTSSFKLRESLGEESEPDGEDALPLEDEIANQEFVEEPRAGHLTESGEDMPGDDAACAGDFTGHLASCSDSDSLDDFCDSGSFRHTHPSGGERGSRKSGPLSFLGMREASSPGLDGQHASRALPEWGDTPGGSFKQGDQTCTRGVHRAEWQAVLNSLSPGGDQAVGLQGVVLPPGPSNFGSGATSWLYQENTCGKEAKTESKRAFKAILQQQLSPAPGNCSSEAGASMRGKATTLGTRGIPPAAHRAKKQSLSLTSFDGNAREKSDFLAAGPHAVASALSKTWPCPTIGRQRSGPNLSHSFFSPPHSVMQGPAAQDASRKNFTASQQKSDPQQQEIILTPKEGFMDLTGKKKSETKRHNIIGKLENFEFKWIPALVSPAGDTIILQESMGDRTLQAHQVMEICRNQLEREDSQASGDVCNLDLYTAREMAAGEETIRVTWESCGATPTNCGQEEADRTMEVDAQSIGPCPVSSPSRHTAKLSLATPDPSACSASKHRTPYLRTPCTSNQQLALHCGGKTLDSCKPASTGRVLCTNSMLELEKDWPVEIQAGVVEVPEKVATEKVDDSATARVDGTGSTKLVPFKLSAMQLDVVSPDHCPLEDLARSSVPNFESIEGQNCSLMPSSAEKPPIDLEEKSKVYKKEPEVVGPFRTQQRQRCRQAHQPEPETKTFSHRPRASAIVGLQEKLGESMEKRPPDQRVKGLDQGSPREVASTSVNKARMVASDAADSCRPFLPPSAAAKPSKLRHSPSGTVPNAVSQNIQENLSRLQQKICQRARIAMVERDSTPEDRQAGLRSISSRERFQQQYQSVNVRYIDTHCHLDFLFHRSNFQGTFQKFKVENRDTFPECFAGCVAVFCNPKSFVPGGLWTDILQEPDVWGAVGCHPKCATDYAHYARGMMRMLSHPKILAVGEIGLDYSGSFQQHSEIQKRVFASQLKVAQELEKPIVIHCRDAEVDCLQIMEKLVPHDYKIHRHCWTGPWEQCWTWMQTFPNSYIGLTPLVTGRSQRAQVVKQVAAELPLNRLLLETDAPYFLPAKIQQDEMLYSHPGMAITVAQEVAKIKGMSLDNVLTACFQNSLDMYGMHL